MKVGTLVAMTCILGVILSSGCGGGSGPETLNVKGLCLGMDITEAQNVCKKLFEGAPLGLAVDDTIGEGGLLIYGIGDENGKYFGFTALGMQLAGGGVTADKNGKINGYTFSGGIVKHIFGVKDMEDSDFVQKFADTYNIPNFNVADNLESWYFSSPNGYRIEIKEGKGLTIKQIARPDGQKFD